LAGRSVAASPALAVRLELVDEKGRKKTITSSPRWQTDTDELKVKSYGNLGIEKWWGLRPPAIDESDDYTQWKRASNARAGTSSAEIELLPGYRVELLRSAGKDEGSWVSLAFDPEGRLTVAREDKGLIRYIFSADRKTISSSELIEGELRECRGLLYAHGNLYVNANNTKGLYRLRDTNGDGTLDEKKLLHSSPGSVGHGRNALALGPEGDIYAIHGDAVDLPGAIVDRTSPLRQQGLPARPREGHVLRLSPDGSRKELFCGGMRNPFGIAFNTDGEAFTYDADAEFDMGSPWYRPTQVMHLSSGADFGWRAVTGSWPPYFPDHPDNTQPTLDIGKGSPTGVRFGTGSHFPPEYSKALYILDWAYGRILAVHLVPRGSSYIGAAEVFLRGQPLNLTDLVFGPDGAMYFTTGGRKTQSALYRVSYSGPKIQARERTRQEKEREALAGEHRKRRREVEAHHGAAKVYDGPLRRPSDDARIAQAVRIALEHAGELPATKARLRKTNAEEGGEVELLAAEAKIAAPGQLPGLVQQWLLENRDWKSWALSRRLGFVDLFRRVLARGQLPARSRELISSTFQEHFPSASGKLNRALAALLVELDPAVSVQKTVRLLADTAVQEERLHYLYHLRSAKLGWTSASRRAFFDRLSSPRSFIGGRGMSGFLKNIQSDARATLSAAE
nr:PQQ-dependent sugar dehydrogenase [Planctomycetota bacterium]